MLVSIQYFILMRKLGYLLYNGKMNPASDSPPRAGEEASRQRLNEIY